MFDADKSGSIDANELTAVLQTFSAAIPEKGSEAEAKMVKEIMETVDVNQDGVIDFEEFCGMM
jgi:Ca2+-binding EF-hand superfamily protein